ncbi:MAG: hypothetical protein AAGI24_12550 [Pseudomonadota bacterium]
MEIKDLLELPVYLQLMLVSGYVGYSTTRRGQADKQRADQVLYGVLVFGFIGSFAYDFAESRGLPFWWGVAASVGASWIAGVVWTLKLRNYYFLLLHRARVTNADDYDSTWDKLSLDTSIAFTQVVVYKKDGSAYSCEKLPDYDRAPIPRFQTDKTGAIALYAEFKKRPDSDDWEEQDVNGDEWGTLLTYIPGSEVAEIRLRVLPVGGVKPSA